MMLKSRYHWVPMSIRKTAATLNPPGILSMKRRKTGKSAVAGIEAAICTRGWRNGGNPRACADGDAERHGPGKGDGKRRQHPQEGRPRAERNLNPLPDLHLEKHLRCTNGAVNECRAAEDRHRPTRPQRPSPLFLRSYAEREIAQRELVDLFACRLEESAAEPVHEARAEQCILEPGGREPCPLPPSPA